jgi:hypothetical protein
LGDGFTVGIAVEGFIVVGFFVTGGLLGFTDGLLVGVRVGLPDGIPVGETVGGNVQSQID